MIPYRLAVSAIVNVATEGRLRRLGRSAVSTQERVAPLLDDDFFAGAPFDRVHVIIEVTWHPRVALRVDPVKGGELPAILVVPYDDLKRVESAAEHEAMFRRVLLDGLVRIADRFGLRATALRTERDEAQRGFAAWWRRVWKRLP